jgi:hypothetical protein
LAVIRGLESGSGAQSGAERGSFGAPAKAGLFAAHHQFAGAGSVERRRNCPSSTMIRRLSLLQSPHANATQATITPYLTQ